MMEDIDMHQAMKKAVEAKIYKDEKLREVEVEEIEWDDEDWLITVGYTRPKTRQTLGGLTIPLRQLKTVKIDQHDGAFKGMINAPRR
jgi:hypothetical protein